MFADGNDRAWSFYAQLLFNSSCDESTGTILCSRSLTTLSTKPAWSSIGIFWQSYLLNMSYFNVIKDNQHQFLIAQCPSSALNLIVHLLLVDPQEFMELHPLGAVAKYENKKRFRPLPHQSLPNATHLGKIKHLEPQFEFPSQLCKRKRTRSCVQLWLE